MYSYESPNIDMHKNNIIVRKSGDQNCIKLDSINYCEFSGAKRVVSQTFLRPSGSSSNNIGKIIRNVANTFPQIAIKKEDPGSSSNSRVLLVNGCWDTSNKIPNIIAEMHNVSSDEFQSFNGNHYKENDIISETREFANPSPRGSDSGIESDCTDGNLSWLLNYKIHELPPVPDTLSSEQYIQNKILTNELDTNNDLTHKIVELKQPHLKELDRNVGPYCRYSALKKPPFTYTELIEHALNEKGELTVSGIYQWISDHFPFYKQNDDRWKNSVRHNLSINPHFRKGGKAVHGAGHLWTIAQKDEKKARQIRQRMQQFIQSNYKDVPDSSFDQELKAATDSILGETYKKIDNGINGVVQENPVPKKEQIEVEYVNIINVPNGLEGSLDFLSPPVSKQEIVQECGLGSDFFITDLNPNTLGLNLTEAIAEDTMYEDMNFEYYEMHKE